MTVADNLHGFIRRSDLSRERSEQRPDRFAPGDRVDARITNIDRKDRRVSLSIKAHEFAEEKQAMAEFGSSDSGASLGDILGAAISRANREREAETDDDQDDATASDAPAAEAEPEEAAAEPEAAAEEEESSDEPATVSTDQADDAAEPEEAAAEEEESSDQPATVSTDQADDAATEQADEPSDTAEEVKPEA